MDVLDGVVIVEGKGSFGVIFVTIVTDRAFVA